MDNYRKILSLHGGAVETLIHAVVGGNAPKGYFVDHK